MRTASVVAMASVVVCLAACESSSPPPPPKYVAPVSGTVGQSTVTVNARVEQIDQATRRVLLRDAAGRGIEMKVPDHVQNLGEVKVGDEVVVSYFESVAYEVKKPGTAQTGVTNDATLRRNDAGELPGAVATQTRTVTVVIEAIDMEKPSVTLRGTNGKLVTVPVRDRSKLERCSVGELVEITYTEALMAAVQPKR